MQLLKDRILKDGIVKPGNILKSRQFSVITRWILLWSMKSEKNSKDVFQTVRSQRFLPLRPPESELHVLWPSILMCRLYLPKRHRPRILQARFIPLRWSPTPMAGLWYYRVKRVSGSRRQGAAHWWFPGQWKGSGGLAALVRDSGAELVGAGIVIEKGFQVGGDLLRSEGIRLESLAIVESMDEEAQTIVFRDDE